MIKPIIRWTIGPVSPEGFITLYIAVKKIQKLYGNLFTYIICYNDLSDFQKSLLPSVDQLIDQKDYINSLPIPPPESFDLRPAWKIYPPRLDLDNYEIIIDNDVIIYKKLPIFDKFLQHNILAVTEGAKRSYSGPFEHLIPQGLNINTGIMCLPPGFDLKNKLIDNLSIWQNRLDEQTLLAYILSKETNLEIIPQSDIFVCCDASGLGKCGVHFVGMNSGFTQHWHEMKYKMLTM